MQKASKSSLLWQPQDIQRTARRFFGTTNSLMAGNVTNYKGPIKAVDPDLNERGTSITFAGEDKRDKKIYISKFNSMGFRLSNDMFAVGPIAIFPRFVLQWKVGRIGTLTAEAFTPFFLLEPKIDALLVGFGDPEETVPMELRKEIARRGRCGVDFMQTDKAVGIFNFMVEEDRYVAGLFIPPIKMKFGEDDIYAYNAKIQDKVRLMHRFTDDEHPLQ